MAGDQFVPAPRDLLAVSVAGASTPGHRQHLVLLNTNRLHPTSDASWARDDTRF